jgi:hypothetical protein
MMHISGLINCSLASVKPGATGAEEMGAKLAAKNMAVKEMREVETRQGEPVRLGNNNCYRYYK